MPAIPPIGVKISKYLEVPSSSLGPAIDPAKGYRVQDLGSGLYMITDNGYQSMFLVYDRGVVVMDAPPSFAVHIPEAIAKITDKPITHLIYSHSHADHIGGAKALGGHPIIIAHADTLRLLKRAADPNGRSRQLVSLTNTNFALATRYLTFRTMAMRTSLEIFSFTHPASEF
jgi:glyoxylase-like metal-dependent hydrolase (beta-lactamase superfamily II)